MALLFACAASPALGDDTCANAAQRAQGNSTELPDCRAYEMVSPPYKEGFDVVPRRFTDDDIVSYTSTGNFADNAQSSVNNLYLAARTSAGWNTTAPSPSQVFYDTLGGSAQRESDDLRSSLWLMQRAGQSGLLDYYLRTPGGEFARIGQGSVPGIININAVLVGASPDLSRIVFSHGAGSGASSALYELAGTGNEGPGRPVSVDNDGVATPGQTCTDGVSTDVRVIVFSSDCSVGIPRLWARVGGSATVAVSGSECTRAPTDLGGACNRTSAASYAGAAADGSRLLFTTQQQLVNGDTDTSNDLYACDIPAGSPAPVGASNPCATLTDVSMAPGGAQVENVVAVSDDGSRVYFVAQGVVADNVGVGNVRPNAGAHNLYLWEQDAAHPAGHTTFITGLGVNDLLRSQMTPDGRYLAFVTANRIVTSGTGGDTDSAQDVYRYDVATNTAVRVSTTVWGGGGNDSAFDASLGGSPTLALSITPDGASIIFDTAEALSSRDTDGVTDVYAWHSGHVSLISSGGGQALWISSSGRDIFFSTSVALVATDGDVNGDIYDARAGGGFDLPQRAPCSGVACRGEQSLPPSLVGPSTPRPADPREAGSAPSFSVRTVSSTQRKRLAVTGKITLIIVANAPGSVGARATSTIDGRSLKVASAQRTLTAPGTVAMPLTLSRKARARLAARGRLTVKVAVDHSKVALDRSVTLRLVRAAARQKSARGGGRS